MRPVLLTQRVEIIESYQERRDCLDQNWSCFVQACGFMPIPVMNLAENLEMQIKNLQPAGILLTGGNDLVAYGGSAPERDKTEEELLRLAIKYDIPVVGVCRGMQMIHAYFGGKLEKVTGHVATRHMLQFEGYETNVNSYHGWAIKTPQESFEVLAQTEDGVIEAMRHKEKKILAMMWHPEREHPFQQRDITLIKDFMDEGGLMSE